MVSLHGDSAVLHDNAVGSQGAYQQTLAGIDALVGRGDQCHCELCLFAKNVGSIVKTAGMLADLCAEHDCYSSVAFPGVKDHQDWAMRKEQFRQYFDALVYAKDKGLNLDSTLPVAPCILFDMFPMIILTTWMSFRRESAWRVCLLSYLSRWQQVETPTDKKFKFENATGADAAHVSWKEEGKPNLRTTIRN